jgi:hypothetical protein
MSELSNNDYKNILEFYNEPIPKSEIILKKKAEKILASKLCRCIKKIDHVAKSQAIGICTKTVINKKGYVRGIFKCKRKQTIKLKKNKKTLTEKRKN